VATVRRAAVIGTGTMGPGMGAVLARAGIETALYDLSAEALERAKAGAELAGTVLERLEAAQEDGGSLRFESDLDAALEGADFVLEAVPEKLELKQEVFPKFEAAVSDDAILASNTSGIPITQIA
jgi:3-hydroxyacyl-CoA dehydrogenase